MNYVNYDPARWCADGRGQQDFCGPAAFPGRAPKLFRNLGDSDGDGKGDVRFEDVTVPSGLGGHSEPGLAVFCADFDGDRWPDIFITIDGKPNHLWMNQRDGTFLEEAVVRGLAFNNMGNSEANMGIAIGDVDGDGFFDIFVPHLTTETHTLWMQGPRGIFHDKTVAKGLSVPDCRATGFGTAMVDVDNDGDLDLVIVNGRISRADGSPENLAEELDSFWSPYAQQDMILLNVGSGKFVKATDESQSFSKHAAVSRGLACGDFDNNGALDLLVTNIAGRTRLYRNLSAQKGNWLCVRALDPKLKRDAYGAEIHVAAGEARLMRWINPSYSFLYSNDFRAHFGLGKINQIDHIEVVWPDGDAELFPGTSTNREIVLKKGEGTPIDIPRKAQP